MNVCAHQRGGIFRPLFFFALSVGLVMCAGAPTSAQLIPPTIAIFGGNNQSVTEAPEGTPATNIATFASLSVRVVSGNAPVDDATVTFTCLTPAGALCFVDTAQGEKPMTGVTTTSGNGVASVGIRTAQVTGPVQIEASLSATQHVTFTLTAEASAPQYNVSLAAVPATLLGNSFNPVILTVTNTDGTPAKSVPVSWGCERPATVSCVIFLPANAKAAGLTDGKGQITLDDVHVDTAGKYVLRANVGSMTPAEIALVVNPPPPPVMTIVAGTDQTVAVGANGIALFKPITVKVNVNGNDLEMDAIVNFTIISQPSGGAATFATTPTTAVKLMTGNNGEASLSGISGGYSVQVKAPGTYSIGVALGNAKPVPVTLTATAAPGR
jgi:hypothetical protein